MCRTRENPVDSPDMLCPHVVVCESDRRDVVRVNGFFVGHVNGIFYGQISLACNEL